MIVELGLIYIQKTYKEYSACSGTQFICPSIAAGIVLHLHRTPDVLLLFTSAILPD